MSQAEWRWRIRQHFLEYNAFEPGLVEWEGDRSEKGVPLCSQGGELRDRQRAEDFH